ncbi:MAG: H-NS histone family protein [Pararobbsia sp.]
MATYHELLAQRNELERQIEEARAEEFAAVVIDIKQKMADYSITLAELDMDGGHSKSTKPRASVAPKYRDPVTGATWSGRGKPPKWIAGKDRGGFALS